MASRNRTVAAKPVTEGEVSESTAVEPTAAESTAETTGDESTADESGTGFNFAVVESAEVIKRTVSEKPNPLLNAFKSSLDNGGKTLEFAVPNDDVANVAMNHLRRAAKTLNSGLSVRHNTERGVVIFAAKQEKRSRKYTSEDIRKWAKSEGADDSMLYPRIDKQVRDAFKAQFGKNDAETA